MERKKTRLVKVGNVSVGGNAPIIIQSMTNTKTHDVDATVNQIKKLENAGCELVRVAIPEEKDLLAIPEIKKRIDIPLIADVHFLSDYALRAIDLGADKIRINPGNIGKESKVKQIIGKCKEKGIPLRIGVNAGSLHKKFREKPHGLAKALVESAKEYIRLCTEMDFNKIILSVKASSVLETIEAYKLLSEETDFPLHIGVTEAGLPVPGSVKSALGIGILLYQGIGDTIRVSLTGDPVLEIETAYDILRSLEIRKVGPEIISCPTCGRTHYDINDVVQEIHTRLKMIKQPIKVAVMGCEVNGPGEAREADIGLAIGPKIALLFKKGRVIKKFKHEEMVDRLIKEVAKYIQEEITG